MDNITPLLSTLDTRLDSPSWPKLTLDLIRSYSIYLDLPSSLAASNTHYSSSAMAIPDYTPFLTHLDVVLSIYDKAIPMKAHGRPYLPTPTAVELDPEILIPPIKPLQPISSQSVPDSTPSTHPIAQKAEPTPAPSTHVPLPPTASIPIPTYTGPSDWLTDSILRSLGVVVRRMQGAEAFVPSSGHPISNSRPNSENGYVNGVGTGSVSLTNGTGGGVSRSGSMSARRAAQGLATPGRHTVHSAAPSPTSASTVLPGATNGIQEHASKAKGVSANSTAESKTTMASPFSPIVLGENGENTVRTNSTGEWVFLVLALFFSPYSNVFFSLLFSSDLSFRVILGAWERGTSLGFLPLRFSLVSCSASYLHEFKSRTRPDAYYVLSLLH